MRIVSSFNAKCTQEYEILYGQYISLCELNFKKVFSKKNSYILQRCTSQDFEGVFFQSGIVSIYDNVFGHMG